MKYRKKTIKMQVKNFICGWAMLAGFVVLAIVEISATDSLRRLRLNDESHPFFGMALVNFCRFQRKLL
ncbi:hypothetical protein AMJ86_03230 [bacterium SM23_57]|nr:MAG: hypothetical protein AMJ86_03230 [bacterium SM23_57]